MTDPLAPPSGDTMLREQIDAVGKLLMGYVMDCQQRTVTPHALVGQAVALLSQIEVVEPPALSGRGEPRRELDAFLTAIINQHGANDHIWLVRSAMELLAALARLESAPSPNQGAMVSAMFRVITGALDGDLPKVKAYAEHLATFLDDNSATRLRKILNGDRGRTVILAQGEATPPLDAKE